MNVNTPGLKTWRQTTTMENDLVVFTAPRGDVEITVGCLSLTVDTEDVELLIRGLEDVRGGKDRSLWNSRLEDGSTFEVVRDARDARIEYKDEDDKIPVPLFVVPGFAMILSEAYEYSTEGPCPKCGVSVGNHPSNGCPEPAVS